MRRVERHNLRIPVALVLFPLLLAANDPPDAPAVTPPAPSVTFDDMPLPEHADDVVDYTLTATLDPALHTVSGTGRIAWRNTSAVPAKELWLHLYLNGFKSQKTTFMREPAIRGASVLADPGQIDVTKLVLDDGAGGGTDLLPGMELHFAPNLDDETDARVPLPREIAPDETITLDVAWVDKLPKLIARTGFDGSMHLVGQWFPKLARLEHDGTWAHFPFHRLAEFYADFGTYDVTIDVPASFVIGATGRAIESSASGGRRIERRVQKDVHDFAWTAWDKWQSESARIEGVDVTVLYPPGYRIVARRELAIMKFSLPYFNALYGAYPYDVLTLVHPPDTARDAAGMEYPTFITTGGPWYGPPGIFATEYVTIHEFGHQWFYGLLASDEMTSPFLDEGINSYAEEDAMRAWHAPGSMADLAGLTLDDSTIQAVYGNRAAHDAPVAQPAAAFATGGDYGGLVYERTASVLETIRRVYGDDRMKLALGRYARRFRFKHPGPDDFFASFEEVLGEGVADTLKTALVEKGWVDYKVVQIDPAAQGETGASVLVQRRGTLAFPVEIDLHFSDGTVERREWDGAGDFARIEYAGPRSVIAAVVDPLHTVTIDQDLTNNHASAYGLPRGGAPRTLERATYWGQLFVQAVSP